MYESTTTDDNGHMPMSLNAKLCLAACLSLFAIASFSMLNLSEFVIAAWNAFFSDWRIPTATLLAIASTALVLWAIFHFPKAMKRAAIFAGSSAIALAWYWIATYAANDGSHPVSMILVLTMVFSTIMFSCCATIHFSWNWGHSNFERFTFSFLVSSAFALGIAGIPMSNSYEKDHKDAYLAVFESFKEHHLGKANVPAADVRMSRFTFQCGVYETKPYCLRSLF